LRVRTHVDPGIRPFPPFDRRWLGDPCTSKQARTNGVLSLDVRVVGFGLPAGADLDRSQPRTSLMTGSAS
jgi:hypothetical protein